MVMERRSGKTLEVAEATSIVKRRNKSLYKWNIKQQMGIAIEKKHQTLIKLHRVSARQRYIKELQSQLYLHFSQAATSEVGLKEGFGAVFNLEFSPNGKILVAACEDNAMEFYNPLSMKHIQCVPNAHTDCVNCIRFLDDRTFATGSDDCTVALWDYRNLKRKISELRGHRNWVKSIEYSRDTGQLITSAFDGKIYGWNINSYSSEAAKPKELFSLDRLMRTRLTPDNRKMVLSTSLGYYLIIHDLDLSRLEEDMRDFMPDDYYLLLQENDPKDLNNHISNHVFKRKRNRVELVMDFPANSYPWCISSLVIHPQSWCMISRFTSELEDSEWTCVHDIQADGSYSEKGTIDLADDNSVPFEPTDRLLYYTSEPNDGRGYIKELSVSPDGRFICSSFGFGVRLLAFDEACSELCDINLKVGEAKELVQKSLLLNHQRTVVTSEFSPTHPTLVTGCLGGRIVFHQTRL